MKKPKIGIVGLGVLGGAMLKWYEENGYEVATYDINKECTGKESFSDAEIIFICVPTPWKDKKCNLDALYSTFTWIPSGKTVVIRSTVPPGTTDMFARKYDGTVLFNPEFLDASKAEYDFRFPDRQIIAYPEVNDNLHSIHYQRDWLACEQLQKHLPKASQHFIMKAKEAETVKYMGNTFFALKNVFANMWADYCEVTGIDYERVREAVSAEPRIGPVHLDVHHKGGRGAGGSCLPKDLVTACQFLHEEAETGALLRFTKRANDARLKASGKTNFHGMYEL